MIIFFFTAPKQGFFDTFCSPFSGIDGVISSSVKDTLLSWHDFFVGNKRKKVRKAAPLCIFLTIWRERAFEDKEQNDRKLELLFLCDLFAWVSLYIREGPMALLDFVEWVGSS